MRKGDGIRLLPKRITETLVRAFAALPAVNTDVLILQPVTEPRAPLWLIKDDYNVLWMGEKVRRIYLNLERFEARVQYAVVLELLAPNARPFGLRPGCDPTSRDGRI